MNAKDLLLQWLDVRLEPVANNWLKENCARLSSAVSENNVYTTFGQAVRHVGKNPLQAHSLEQAQAFAFHPGWDLQNWTRDQAARAALLLSLPTGAKTVEMLLALHQTADLGEHLALVRSLFLLPDAKALLHMAREAIRSNMGDVFAAISQYNPYPSEYCDDIAWNQMVVKCLFVDLPIGTIYDLDKRANPELSRIIVSLAKERKAAGRSLSPEAWRCVKPFADEEAIKVMQPSKSEY